MVVLFGDLGNIFVLKKLKTVVIFSLFLIHLKNIEGRREKHGSSDARFRINQDSES